MKHTHRSHFYLSILLMLVSSLKAFALDYYISFTGFGATTSVGAVMVQNLSRGTSLTVPSGALLHLSDLPTALQSTGEKEEELKVLTRSGVTVVSFPVKQSGYAQVTVYNVEGRKIVGGNANLQEGKNSVQLSLPSGIYVIHIVGAGYSFTTKLVQQLGTKAKPEITFLVEEKTNFSPLQKVASATPTLQYKTGDRLLYNGTSGIYSTLVTDVPTASKTVNFQFVECKDADGNNYPVVVLGNRTWMAENLKTTKYRNADPIPNVTDATAWSLLTTGASCSYNNTVSNYGLLYNWPAVADSRNIAPKGWHVATYADELALKDYLIANAYNYDGTVTGNNIAKSLAANTTWQLVSNLGAVGNDLTKNNATGFSALPGGQRSSKGVFSWAGTSAYWWNATPITTGATDNLGFSLFSNMSSLLNTVNQDANFRSSGFAIRCVNDTNPKYSQGLRNMQAEFKFGAAVGIAVLQSDPARTNLVKQEFNSITPENDAKFSHLHPSEKVYDFSLLDYLVNGYAAANNTRIHGHTLVWHSTSSGTPPWIRAYTGNIDLMLKDYITTVVGRYKGLISSWDVANEVMQNANVATTTELAAGNWISQLRPATDSLNFWRARIGDSYIDKAFQYARAADPNALLFYNDYNLEIYDAKCTATINMIKDMVSRGIPIDGIGLQSHIKITQDTLVFAAMLKKFAALKATSGKGLLVHISELDIVSNTTLNNPGFLYMPTLAAAQSKLFAAIVRAYRANVPVDQRYGVTFWGVDDGSCHAGTYNGKDYPLLFNADLTPKPPYAAVVDLFN